MQYEIIWENPYSLSDGGRVKRRGVIFVPRPIWRICTCYIQTCDILTFYITHTYARTIHILMSPELMYPCYWCTHVTYVYQHITAHIYVHIHIHVYIYVCNIDRYMKISLLYMCMHIAHVYLYMQHTNLYVCHM